MLFAEIRVRQSLEHLEVKNHTQGHNSEITLLVIRFEPATFRSQQHHSQVNYYIHI